MIAPGLRARLIATFVAVAVAATLVASLLTGWGSHRSFDRYLEHRAAAATTGASMLARDAYARAGGRWTRPGLDGLAHEFALTGYDVRLTAGARDLLDTTGPNDPRAPLRLLRTAAVTDSQGTKIATIQVFGLSGTAGTPIDAEFRGELDRAHLVAGGIAAALAALLGVVIAGWLARPLRRLAAAARELGAGTPIAPVTGGPPEVQAIGDALSGLSSDLARQDRARRQLAQDLAHELRTPLTLVQARIEAMQDGIVPLDAPNLEVVHTEILRLTRLIGQIERLASAEAHPVAANRAPLPLDTTAGEIHASLLGAFEARGIDLRLDIKPALAHADPDTTLQIAANLLSNALKYTPEGGTVTVTTGTEGAHATLAVRDTGAPIPQREAARVFERFYRGSGALRTGGAGLGLSIARDLAVAQNGSLDLETLPDGNRFVLRLPIVPARPPSRVLAAVPGAKPPRSRRSP